MRRTIFENLGWLFCEISFQLWGLSPDSEHWFWRTCQYLVGLFFNRPGCFFYELAHREDINGK